MRTLSELENKLDSYGARLFLELANEDIDEREKIDAIVANDTPDHTEPDYYFLYTYEPTIIVDERQGANIALELYFRPLARYEVDPESYRAIVDIFSAVIRGEGFYVRATDSRYGIVTIEIEIDTDAYTNALYALSASELRERALTAVETLVLLRQSDELAELILRANAYS